MGNTCRSALYHVPVHHALGLICVAVTVYHWQGTLPPLCFVVILLGSAWRWPALLSGILPERQVLAHLLGLPWEQPAAGRPC